MRHPQPGTQDPPTTALGRGSQVARAIHGMETVALLYDSEQETVSALEEFMFGETRSITDIVCVDGAPGAGQYIACTAASWGPDSTICTGRMQRKEVHLQTRKYSLTRRQICQCLDLGFPNLQSCGKINFLLRMFRPSSLW
ncbi:uncharacterized protein LOC109279056 isoform X12 [Panthera pardus]|uniref:Uncharacterized protein LOC109279056 isoform X12 n=1 Tax=Panthera pardus TaxID=9691 RepID=A0A9W2V5S9_PANPR|nr:uncharacterized protein LOC109279056 isoform X12 [Panthera pardus]